MNAAQVQKTGWVWKGTDANGQGGEYCRAAWSDMEIIPGGLRPGILRKMLHQYNRVLRGRML
jgi:hypothetical protein